LWFGLCEYPLWCFCVKLLGELRTDKWSRVSIAVISTLVAKTDLLGDDPLLWFTMMLMPTGPPAMKLTALAEATHVEDEEKMAITKFLSVCGHRTSLSMLGNR